MLSGAHLHFAKAYLDIVEDFHAPHHRGMLPVVSRLYGAEETKRHSFRSGEHARGEETESNLRIASACFDETTGIPDAIYSIRRVVRSVWLVARLMDVRFNTPPCGCAFAFTVVHVRVFRKLLLVLLAVNSCCY